MSNAISWFELPTIDFDRATKFYSEILGESLQFMEMGPAKMGFFPSSENGVGGCIIGGDGSKPSTEGALVYLNGGSDLTQPLSRVEKSGGKVLQEKTSIGEHGYFGVFLDTEGNRVAFHSIS